ncbi:amidohydrolase [Streptomyces sp. BV286]|uniref:amidohydrolase n=1 Tax=Streptomyces sp. BV286 TaxID=2849672 RepID=UPI001C2E9A3C|nr:amidohydrolase [Streptomyces sp. BV286]MBV1935625.1 amidohydrolase [Streptomyces sp. BV286]
MEHRLARRAVLAAMAAIPTTAALPATDAAASSAEADLVLRNGYVWTVDARDSIRKAVAVRDGKIIYVGTDNGAAHYIGRRTQVVDLGGRMVMPGLHDGHLHSLAGGSGLLNLDFAYASLTVAEFLDRISAYLAESADQEPLGWVIGSHWYVQAMRPTGVTVTRKDLDGLTTERPIAISSSDFHTMLVNSRALELAQITKDTPDPAGGIIERDAAGEPTGILQDSATALIGAVLPPPTDADNLRYAEAALAALRAQGVTTFMDAAADENMLRAYATLAEQGKLTARAHFAPLVDLSDENPLPRLKRLRRRYDTGALRARPDVHVGNVKVFLDGVLQAPAQTAAVLESYLVDDGHGHMVPGTRKGTVYWPQDRLDAFFTEVAAAGFDPHTHAIGDHAVQVALNAFGAVRRAGHRRNRLTIAHAELVSPADIPRFHRLDVVASMGFHWAKPGPDSTDSVEPYLGPERYENFEPEGAIFRAGGRVSLGSDWPVDPLNEWNALRTVITRTALPGTAYTKYGTMTPSQRLQRRTAIRAATLHGAYQLRQEHRTGSIEVGKLADLIVLDRNILKIPADDIGNTRVLLTLVGGKPVHGSYETLS